MKINLSSALIAAGLVLISAAAQAQGQQAQDTPSGPHIIYPASYDSNYRLIDPESAATATGSDQIAREDTHRPAKAQEKPAVIRFHKKPKHKA